MFNGIPFGFTKGVMTETPWGAVCPGMFLSVLMIGGKCSPFRAKVAHISGLPTGCTTRWNSSGIELESSLHGSPVFIRQRYY
jgi:hypothetical protein